MLPGDLRPPTPSPAEAEPGGPSERTALFVLL